MAVEIERKFLVINDSWKKDIQESFPIKQGFLSSDPERNVRVRIKGSKGYITVKGETKSISRIEFEYEIPLSDAEEILKLCLQPIIEKVRHEIMFDGHTWEVDEFFGVNDGLIIAELELTSEQQLYNSPEWIGKEVSNDAKYYNSNLILSPYSHW